MKKLTVLGSGDAFATAGKHTTSFLLHDESGGYLIDCGATTLVRLKQINYPLDQLKGIFISHFHGDHFGGIPFVMLSLKIECDLKGSFFIAGPPQVKEKVTTLQEVMYPGTSAFVDELGVEFKTYQPKTWMDMDDLSVCAYPVTHSPLSNPHGLKFKWEEAMFAFSGDTEWDDNLIELADQTRLFITECNNYQTESPGHLSLKTLQTESVRLNSDRILLSHMGQDVLGLKSCPFERLYDGMEITLW